ncbi:MAG: DUF4912 domain-containing protein [Pirellula sp.]|nr:DUF4912 domain-containing protein [Pirellula sp.]
MSTARKKTDSKNRKSPAPSKSSKKSPAVAKKPAISKSAASKKTDAKTKPAVKAKPEPKSLPKTKSAQLAPKSKKPAVAAKPTAKPSKQTPKAVVASKATKPATKNDKLAAGALVVKPTKIHSSPKPASKQSTKNPAKSPEKATKPEKVTTPVAPKPSEPSPPKAKKKLPAPPPTNTNPDIVAKIRSAQAEKEQRKDLAQPAPKPSLVPTTPIPMIEKGKDRLVLMVRDAFWLHAHWDITRHSVDRARVSIAENWHTAKPVLRLIKIDDMATTSNAETVYRDIEIHGGVRNWYVEIETPGAAFQVLMGYLTSNGRFYELARSNMVTMPQPGSKDAMDDHWAEIAKNAEKIFALSGGYSEESNSGDLKEVFEERLKRTMETDVLSQFGSGAEGSLKRNKQFHFNVEAELVVFGDTTPDAHVNIAGEPVKVRPDGTFSLRMQFPDKRQVLRVSAKSRDGVEEQTVVIAVERNTKIMEPLSLDADEL